MQRSNVSTVGENSTRRLSYLGEGRDRRAPGTLTGTRSPPVNAHSNTATNYREIRKVRMGDPPRSASVYARMRARARMDGGHTQWSKTLPPMRKRARSRASHTLAASFKLLKTARHHHGGDVGTKSAALNEEHLPRLCLQERDSCLPERQVLNSSCRRAPRLHCHYPSTQSSRHRCPRLGTASSPWQKQSE